jgi:anti-anti-sigma factor
VTSKKQTVILKNIRGVTVKIDLNKVQVTFKESLDFFEWQGVQKNMNQLLDNGYFQWVFDLKELAYPTSIDIGMWVTCNAKVCNKSGEMEFLINQESKVHKILSATKLDKILHLNII